MSEPDAGRYFAQDPELRPSGQGRYVEVGDLPSVEFVPGLGFQPLVGERGMVNWVRFEPHTEAPRHAHEEEQYTIVLEGEFEFDLDGDVRVMRPGMAAVIPPGVPHGARTHDIGCLEIDVFVPPRKVLLEKLRADQEAGGGEPGAAG